MDKKEPLQYLFNVEVGGNFDTRTREILRVVVAIESALAMLEQPKDRAAVLAFINARHTEKPQP